LHTVQVPAAGCTAGHCRRCMCLRHELKQV
jgi:hypothetical protein